MENRFEGALMYQLLEDYTVSELLRAAKYQLQNGKVIKSRESSLVQTKIDEALLWYSQCDFIGDDE